MTGRAGVAGRAVRELGMVDYDPGPILGGVAGRAGGPIVARGTLRAVAAQAIVKPRMIKDDIVPGAGVVTVGALPGPIPARCGMAILAFIQSSM